jgi:arginine decarboxylase
MKARTRRVAGRDACSEPLETRRRRGTISPVQPARSERPGAGVAAPETAGLPPSERVDLKDFFAASEAREDRWQQLSSVAEAWRKAAHRQESAESASSHPLQDEAASILQELEPLETFWAFPGLALLSTVREALTRGDVEAFARLTAQISRYLLGGAYRHDPNAQNLSEQGDGQAVQRAPAYFERDGHRPYFEVLVVRDGVLPEQRERARTEVRKLRRPEDAFNYELAYVSTFEDALVAVIFNYTLEAVVIYDHFPFRSKFGLPIFDQLLRRYVPEATDAGASTGLALAKWVKRIRPELDLYLLTDRAVEALATEPDLRHVRRLFYDVEEVMELHLSILKGVDDRYDTPFFTNLKRYSRRPVGTFHALPVARGKSIFRSNWIQDMGHFYGPNLFLAESSATTGGLDSLLEPTGNIKKAQEKAARCFGAQRTYFGTNGTSTSNKIVLQALVRPGDIVLIDRNCHKSHHYGLVLSGACPVYLEAFPLNQFSMYGGVPLKTIKRALLELKAAGKLDRVRMLDLTNCTFDGHMYHPRRVMEECLAIKPDLVFLWDEAWFSFARFSPFHRRRTGMDAAEALRQRYRDPSYRSEYEAFKKKAGGLEAGDRRLLDMHLLPDPDRVRIRVYVTQSTHKSLSSLRQGSMIHVNDDDFELTEESFEEAFFTHTSTSPNQQIIASLDIARRQAELEGFELVMRHSGLALRLRREVNRHPFIAKYFRLLTPSEMIPAEFRPSGMDDFGPPTGTWDKLVEAWNNDEFALDPTRLTLLCGTAGFDGTQFKSILADRFDIQINKTSRNTVLLMTNINNTRSDIAYVIKVLAELSAELEAKPTDHESEGAKAFAARVESLVKDVPDLPNFSAFHDAFRPHPVGHTPEGNMREAFFMAYEPADCEHLKLFSKEMDARLKHGPPLVSANFVIPYPPGFPIMVPGQIISPEIIAFMRKLDVKEIHGYHAAHGIKVLKPQALSRLKGKNGRTEPSPRRTQAAAMRG